MDSSLFNFDALSVSYVNHDGTELPLKNIKDFNEAIKSAKWKGKNHLNLIFYDHKIKANEAAALNEKFAIIGRFTNNQKVPMVDTDLTSNNASQFIEGFSPEWLKQYMEKFKKEILKDLRTIIREIIQEEFEKRKKLDEAKLFKLLSHKMEFSSPKKLKKKKKISDKEGFDLLEKGETKLLKKIDKLHLSKFDKMMVSDPHLEKLVNRSRIFLDEKRKLLEKIHQIKLRESKKTWEHEKKSMKSEKSAVFYKNDVFLFLQPGAEFSVTVKILNNGTVPWVSPHMECIKATAVLLKEPIIELPRLKPGQSVNATLRGKVSEKLGNCYFAYKLCDCLEEFGPLFWCFPVVSDLKNEVISNSLAQPKPEKISFPTGGLLGLKFNSEKDLIESSQKKIKENMIEIERNLQNLHLIKFRHESREGNLNNYAGSFEVRACNLLQDKEKKCFVEKLEEEEIFEADPLQQQEETEKTKQMDANVKIKNFQTDKYEQGSHSDSKLSITFIPEEDENFIFVPSNSKCSNSSTSNNSTKLIKFDLNKESNEVSQNPKKETEDYSAKVELKEVCSEESSTSKNCVSSPLVSEEKRFSIKAEPLIESFGTSTKEESRRVISNESTKENIPGNVSFKVFKEGDSPLKNSRFNSMSEENLASHSTEEISFARNTKSEDKTSYVQNAFSLLSSLKNYFSLSQDPETSNTARKNHRMNVLTRDCFGKPIYAVRMDGYCLPVTDLIQDKVEISHSDNEKRKPSMENLNNILYNFYRMGAEERQYVEKLENKEKYINSMLTLHEMGFLNNDLNFRLLKKHDSELINVLSEIFDMSPEYAE